MESRGIHHCVTEARYWFLLLIQSISHPHILTFTVVHLNTTFFHEVFQTKLLCILCFFAKYSADLAQLFDLISLTVPDLQIMKLWFGFCVLLLVDSLVVLLDSLIKETIVNWVCNMAHHPAYKYSSLRCTLLIGSSKVQWLRKQWIQSSTHACYNNISFQASL